MIVRSPIGGFVLPQPALGFGGRLASPMASLGVLASRTTDVSALASIGAELPPDPAEPPPDPPLPPDEPPAPAVPLVPPDVGDDVDSVQAARAANGTQRRTG